MKEPPRWTDEQLAREAEHARAAFRRERLDEPLQRWKEAFDRHRAQFERLFDEFGLGDPATIDHGKLARAQNEDGLTIFWAHRLEDVREFIEETKTGPSVSG